MAASAASANLQLSPCILLQAHEQQHSLCSNTACLAPSSALLTIGNSQ
jgi:hypothetical protein